MADEVPGDLATIIDQIPDTNVSRAGRFQEGVRVYIRTASGMEDSFFVPNELYSTEYVVSQAQVRALELERTAATAVPWPARPQ